MAEYKAKLFSNHGFEMLLVLKDLPHLSANEEFVQMFVDEAKITVELRHQNIVQMDFGCMTRTISSMNVSTAKISKPC